MTAITALAPIIGPICGLIGILGGGWFVFRQNARQTDATARTTSEATNVTAMKTVTDAFTAVVAEQRTHQERTAERITLLEAKVGVLEEEQRTARRWKTAAVRYVEILRHKIAELGGEHPQPEDVLRRDLGD